MKWSCLERGRGREVSLEPGGSDRSGTGGPRIGHAKGCWAIASSFFGLARRSEGPSRWIDADKLKSMERPSTNDRPTSAITSGTAVTADSAISALSATTKVLIATRIDLRPSLPQFKSVTRVESHFDPRPEAGTIEDTRAAPGELLSAPELRTLVSTSVRQAHTQVCAHRIEALHAAWPKGELTAPPGFIDGADRLQHHKEIVFLESALRTGLATRRDRLQAAIELAGQMHGTPGHTANRVALAEALLDSPEAHLTFGVDGAKKAQILEAARWMNLADRDLPVELAAAKRQLTPQERARHIAPRMANSARLYLEMALGDESNARLIAQTRQKEGTRPIAAQFLDLVDRLAALSAKPFFRDGGEVNVKKVFAALQEGAAGDGLALDPLLVAAVRGWAEAGGIDRTLQSVRPQDIYLR